MRIVEPGERVLVAAVDGLCLQQHLQLGDAESAQLMDPRDDLEDG